MNELANPDLIRAIQAVAAADTPMNRRAVFQVLSESTLIVPFWDVAGAEPSPHRPLAIAVGDSDEPCLPAFTDWAAVGRWSNRAAPQSYASLRTPAIFLIAERLRIKWVWVNLGSPPALRVNRAAIAILAKGGVPTGLEGDDSESPA